MVLGALENLLDINFNPDINISCLNFTKIEDGDRFQKEGETLHLNLAELDPETREEVLTLPQSQFEEKGRVLRHEEENETRAIEAGFGEDKKEVLDYFDKVLSDRHLDILDAGLHLQALIDEQDISRDEIHERKRDVAKRHGPNAYYICSLVTAGYFHENGGLRDIYVDLGLNQEYSKYDFPDVLDNLAENKLVCLFVESNDSVQEVTQEAKGRFARYQREDPVQKWFDIRGIGDNCEDIIDGVMDELEGEFIGIDFDDWTQGDDLWVRIYPRSLPTLSQ